MLNRFKRSRSKEDLDVTFNDILARFETASEEALDHEISTDSESPERPDVTQAMIVEVLFRLQELGSKVEDLDRKVDALDEKMHHRNEDGNINLTGLTLFEDLDANIADIKTRISAVAEISSIFDLSEMKANIDDLHNDRYTGLGPFNKG